MSITNSKLCNQNNCTQVNISDHNTKCFSFPHISTIKMLVKVNIKNKKKDLFAITIFVMLIISHKANYCGQLCVHYFSPIAQLEKPTNSFWNNNEDIGNKHVHFFSPIAQLVELSGCFKTLTYPEKGHEHIGTWW